MAKTYRIKAFSQMTGTTVRALQYYDRIGLLRPSARSSSGCRLYSVKDLPLLQQIIVLKFLGFSLKAIKTIQSITNSLDVADMLKFQHAALTDQIQSLEKASRLTQELHNQLLDNGEIDWAINKKFVEVLSMNQENVYEWAKKLFNNEELAEFQSIKDRFSQQYLDDYNRRWAYLFVEVKKNINTDPEGPVGQRLVRQWLELVDEAYAGHDKVRGKLWQAFKEGAAPEEMPYYDQEVISYIEKASKVFKK